MICELALYSSCVQTNMSKGTEPYTPGKSGRESLNSLKNGCARASIAPGLCCGLYYSKYLMKSKTTVGVPTGNYESKGRGISSGKALFL